MKFITLLTDFGQRDGYTGVMKGVIYRILPEVQIADISHTIRPQNVLEGSLVWSRSYRFFPEGTVHVAVVDPGVGTQRRPIAARIGSYFFVCPDNGLITPILEEAEKAGKPVKIVHLNQPRYWLPQVSNVFHGRDVFAPSAAYIASGISLADMGAPINDPVRKSIPQPKAIENGWRGEVIAIDHFGNLSTNLSQAILKELKTPRVSVAGREVGSMAATFGDRSPGELVALIDSDGNLSVAIVNGDAARELGARLGDPVEVVKGGA